jgi:hypothetical protein
MTRPAVLSVSILLVTACKITAPTAPTYVVAYHLTVTSGLRCDSVKYLAADGSIARVVSPALPWSVAFTAATGSSIQTTAWVVATASGETATLKMTWTISGVSTAKDSSTGTTSAAGAFMLAVARRQL